MDIHERPPTALHKSPGQSDFYSLRWTPVDPLAEVDGNRTRRTGIARPNRFEGGGAHQVLGHLRTRPYPTTSLPTPAVCRGRVPERPGNLWGTPG